MEKLYHNQKSAPSASPVGAGGALGASYLVWERGGGLAERKLIRS